MNGGIFANEASDASQGLNLSGVVGVVGVVVGVAVVVLRCERRLQTSAAGISSRLRMERG